LGELADPDAIAHLAQRHVDPDCTVRAYAAEALGKIDHPDVVPPLCDYLRDRRRMVRLDAAKALARVGDEGAVVPLEEAIVAQRYPFKVADARPTIQASRAPRPW